MTARASVLLLISIASPAMAEVFQWRSVELQCPVLVAEAQRRTEYGAAVSVPSAEIEPVLRRFEERFAGARSLGEDDGNDGNYLFVEGFHPPGIPRRRLDAMLLRLAEGGKVDGWVIDGTREAAAFLSGATERLERAIERQKPAGARSGLYIASKAVMATFYLTVAPVVLVAGWFHNVPQGILLAPAAGIVCGVWALTSALRARVRERVPFVESMPDAIDACTLEPRRLVAFGGDYFPPTLLEFRGPVSRDLAEDGVPVRRAVRTDAYFEPGATAERGRLWIFAW